MNKRINIAIDGYSSCGKSTLAKQLAKHLNYIFIDTGAMYRAVTYYLLTNEIDIQHEALVQSHLQHIHLNFKVEGDHSIIQLNGEDVESHIRTMRVSSKVSEVAKISAVRKFLVKQQQEIASQKGVVMDGRDIGTVVMPNAELKLFLTADKEERVRRRYEELLLKGDVIRKEEVQKNLEHRDYIDSHRQDSPLTKAEDAILIDNTNLSMSEQFEFVLNLVNKRINAINENV